jgi:hypothetical protein
MKEGIMCCHKGWHPCETTSLNFSNAGISIPFKSFKGMDIIWLFSGSFFPNENYYTASKSHEMEENTFMHGQSFIYTCTYRNIFYLTQKPN